MYLAAALGVVRITKPFKHHCGDFGYVLNHRVDFLLVQCFGLQLDRHCSSDAHASAQHFLDAISRDRREHPAQLLDLLFTSSLKMRLPCLHADVRSDEHTSALQSLMPLSSAVFGLKKELQSLMRTYYAVFCLQKKKKD